MPEKRDASWKPQPTRQCPKNKKHTATQLFPPIFVNGGFQKIYYCNDCRDLGHYVLYADGK